MLASQRVRFQKKERGQKKKAGWGFILCFCWQETIYSQSGKWPRQDKFQFSQLEIGGHQKCKREQQFEPDKVSTTWLILPLLLLLSNPFIRCCFRSADSASDHLRLRLFKGRREYYREKARKDPPFQMRRHMMITIQLLSLSPGHFRLEKG